jgi:ankyrin repeat protein
MGKHILVNKLLRIESLLVYEYDEQKQTALHWAVMREHPDIVKILIAKKSNVNARDIIGRTPLFHAAKLNNLKIVKLLLAARANPLIMTGNGKGPNNITKDPEILKYLTKATLLVICLPMIKQPWVRQQVWEDEGLHMFSREVDDESRDDY